MPAEADLSPLERLAVIATAKPYLTLVGVAVLSFAWLAWTGKLHGSMEQDSRGYLNFDWSTAESALSEIRTPGYPALIAIARSTLGIERIPVYHVLAAYLAAMIFYFGLVLAGCRSAMALICTIPLFFSRGLFDVGHVITPDSIAISATIAGVGFFLMTLRSESRFHEWIGLAAMTFAAYFFRPAYLFLIPLWPILAACLDWMIVRRASPRIELCLRSVNYLSATLLPFFGYCSLRLYCVGHFGLISFGGYNIVGIAGQALDQETVAAMPNDLQPLALQLLEKRNALDDYQSPDSYIAMENMYNPMIWQVAHPIAKQLYSEDSIKINQALSRISRETLWLRPAFYSRWLVGNAIHAAKQYLWLTFKDFGLLLIIGVWFFVFGLSLWNRPRLANAERAASSQNCQTDSEYCGSFSRAFIEIHLVAWIAIGIVTAKTLLVILVEPSLERYLIGAMCLIPSAFSLMIAQHMQTCFICSDRHGGR